MTRFNPAVNAQDIAGLGSFFVEGESSQGIEQENSIDSRTGQGNKAETMQGGRSEQDAEATSRSRAPSAAGADRARAGTVTRHARRGAGRRPGEDVSPGTGPASRLDEASGGAARVGQEDRRLRAAPC
jgi:hypothetical protein